MATDQNLLVNNDGFSCKLLSIWAAYSFTVVVNLSLSGRNGHILWLNQIFLLYGTYVTLRSLEINDIRYST